MAFAPDFLGLRTALRCTNRSAKESLAKMEVSGVERSRFIFCDLNVQTQHVGNPCAGIPCVLR